MAEVERLVGQLRTAFRGQHVDTKACLALLSKIKLGLLQYNLLPPFHRDPAVAKKQLLVAREALELGALVSISAQDKSMFERYMAQLRAYYFDYIFLPPSDLQWPILGLNLMDLLVSNKLSEFHTEVELIPPEAQENKFVQFPLRLEQGLMEGSYNDVLSANSSLPRPEYGFFMNTLADTVRNKIADCTEKAYDSMPLRDAQQLLMLSSAPETKAYIKQRATWRVEGDRVVFPQTENQSKDIPASKLILQTLSYATELERIV